jgi:hypothetical protein
MGASLTFRIGRWVAKLVARLLLASAALWVRIQTSPEYYEWAISAKELPTHSSPQKRIKKIKIYQQEHPALTAFSVLQKGSRTWIEKKLNLRLFFFYFIQQVLGNDIAVYHVLNNEVSNLFFNS